MQIVVTGFGPFRSYRVNPSWEAVAGLPACWAGEQCDAASLTVEQIPVEYSWVEREVPGRWGSPDFVVHVGVSHLADRHGNY